MRKQSPYLSLSVLVAFHRGLVELTEDAFYEHFDVITEFLGTVNNEQHRLVKLPPEGHE